MSWHQLHLTSPHLTDAKVAKLGGDPGQVTHLQQLLESYGVDPGTIDGDYGLHTAQAVHVAKFRLGYRRRDCTQIAGARLVRYLHDPKSRPAAFKLRASNRAKARAKRLAAVPKRLQALNWLKQHIGTSENPPGSNRNFITTWYGMVGPWCAMAQSMARAMVKLPPFKAGHYYSYVPYITADAVAGRNGLSVTTNPQPGDLVVYAWGGAGSNPMGDHVGAFIEWTDRNAGQFLAREGNTSLENDPTGSQSDGGILTDRHRSTANVVHFCRVHEA